MDNYYKHKYLSIYEDFLSDISPFYYNENNVLKFLLLIKAIVF